MLFDLLPGRYLRELVHIWLDEGSLALRPDIRGRIEQGPALPVRAFKANIPCGPPGAAWGLLSLSRRTSKGAPVNAVIPTAAPTDYTDYSVESAENLVRAPAPILPAGMPDPAYGRPGVPHKVALIDPSEISG